VSHYNDDNNTQPADNDDHQKKETEIFFGEGKRSNSLDGNISRANTKFKFTFVE
jgi:hypothetical protein